jgi:transcriptional regulator with XRE-family HTH domain
MPSRYPGKNKIDLYVIERVRELRLKKGISQAEIAAELGYGASYIGNIESLNTPAKYNVNHLNKIAKVFECSPRDFLPEKPL